MSKVGLLIGGGNLCLENKYGFKLWWLVTLTAESRSLILQEIEDKCDHNCSYELQWYCGEV